MSERFQVATVTGWRINLPVSSRGNANAPEGLSASVCDTAYNWRVLRTYRSEEYRAIPGSPPRVLGRAEALRCAEDHARYLNRLFAGR